MPKPYRSPDRGRYQRIRMESMYLPMRDGVRLAVDVYFPEPFDLNRKYPALLHQTRYWRLPELRWPFSLLSNGLLGHTGGYVKELVLNGFVFVNVDSRGSGASFGQREYPWGPDEVKDGSDMADWIVEQSWSNGKIGGVGISYTGTTAEFLLANQHPAVKAAMPLFSLYDVYDDIAFPGGVPHDGFVLNWGKANGQLDRNEFPLKNPIAQLMVKGVKPVGGKKGRKELAAAVEDHKGNRQVSETSEGVIYRDQTPKTGVVESMADFSPHHFRENIGGGGAALYSASGWMDGGYQHAAVKRWRNASNPVNKLMLGPWDHGARFHITPGQERTMDLDVVDEAVKYFDHFLKDYATGILDEPPVHYYTMQEEKWKMA
ncbi:MAG: CocE/NonD family hydrolase, partial [Bacteroidota bacterium]